MLLVADMPKAVICYNVAVVACRTACFHLEEYETALQCFEQGQQLAPDMPKFRNWIRKCKAELDGEELIKYMSSKLDSTVQHIKACHAANHGSTNHINRCRGSSCSAITLPTACRWE
jgi:uncharacterized protein Usg